MLRNIILLLALSYCVYADLPIHCLRHQVVGLWNVSVTEPAVYERGHYPTCGHKQPDDPKQCWKAGLDIFRPEYNFQFQLFDNFTALMIDENFSTVGRWTMIYDEGLDVIFPEERFTNFFYYYPIGRGNHQSNCGKTTVGWYSNKKKEKACWRAFKILAEGERPEDLLGMPTDQKNIVQPEYLTNSNVPARHRGIDRYPGPGGYGGPDDYDEPYDPNPYPYPYPYPYGGGPMSFLEIQSRSSMLKKKARHSQKSLEPEPMGSKYDKEFTGHDEIVENLNRIPEKSWTAKAHPDFATKSLGELNNMAGRKATFKTGRGRKLPSRMLSEDVSDLPREFSWKHVISQPRQQLSCGSCYLVATLMMIEARLRIKYNEDVKLSIQHPLDCSYFNQGCEGGYPYLVGLFASEYELVPDSCAPYLAKHNQCGTCDVSKLDKIYKVSDFRFVGGAYGNCSERAMMEELMNKGPIVVSFEPTSDFMYYNGGVYHSVDAEWVRKGLDKPEWEKVDHSVLLYGWGETETGQKYWILRNSWGSDWGEDGDFRIKRGVDESAVESLAEAADPIIVYKERDV